MHISDRNIDAPYIAPYAAVTGFTSTSADYGLSDGLKANTGNARSTVGEAGVMAGHNFALKDVVVKPYAKVAVQREFTKSNHVRVNDDGFTNDFSGQAGVYQVGVDAVMSKNLSLHADAGYSEGNHIESPWTGTVGVSYSFR